MHERIGSDQSSSTPENAVTAPIEIHSPDGDLTLRQFTPSDAQELFGLIDSNREYLSQFGEPTSHKYPTVESVLDSIQTPRNPNKLRFGMRDNKGKLVGSINLTVYPKIKYIRSPVLYRRRIFGKRYYDKSYRAYCRLCLLVS